MKKQIRVKGIICQCGCGEELQQKYAGYIPKFKVGHNQRGKNISVEHKKVISEFSKNLWKNKDFKEKTGAKISNSLKGRILSKEWKEKLSISHKGMRNSPLTEFKKGHMTWNKGLMTKKLKSNCSYCKEIIFYSKNKSKEHFKNHFCNKKCYIEYQKLYVSSPMLGNITTLNHRQNISKALKGKNFGFKWKKEGKNLSKEARLKANETNKQNTIKKLDSLNVKDLYIKKGLYITEISRLHRLSSTTIVKYLKLYGIKVKQHLYASKKLVCDDGHFANSNFERYVDNWLYHHNIPHIIHYKVFKDRKFTADFKIYDLLIECDGLGISRPKIYMKDEKYNLYRENNINFVVLIPKDDINFKLTIIIDKYTKRNEYLRRWINE